MINLAELRKKAEAATKGPLKINRYEHGGGRMYREEPRQLVMDTYEEGDREFYAALSPETVLALVEIAEAADEMLRKAEVKVSASGKMVSHTPDRISLLPLVTAMRRVVQPQPSEATDE